MGNQTSKYHAELEIAVSTIKSYFTVWRWSVGSKCSV